MLPISCSSFVSFSWEGKTEFGCIEHFFSYRSQEFAKIARYDCIPQKIYGLVNMKTNKTVKTFIGVEHLSRPHTVSIDGDELWILD